MPSKRKLTSYAGNRSVRKSTRQKTDASVALAIQRGTPPPPPLAAVFLTTEQLQPTIASTSPFFTNLPRELRDQIYHYLWSSTTIIIQRYLRKDYYVTYGNQPLPSNVRYPHERRLYVDRKMGGKACWLLTSKQFMTEGLQQFHLKSTWHFQDHSANVFRQYKQPGRPYIKSKRDYTFPLITPGTVRVLTLNTGPGEYHTFQEPRYLDTEVTFLSSTKEVINSMAPSILSGDSVVRELRIMLWYGNEGFFREPHYTFNFSALEQLAAHTSLEMVEVCWSAQIAGYGPFRSVQQPSVNDPMRETSQIGRLLVEGGVESQPDTRHVNLGGDSQRRTEVNQKSLCWFYKIQKD